MGQRRTLDCISIGGNPLFGAWVWTEEQNQRFGGRVLVIRSDQSWHLAFFSEVTGLTDSIEVIVIQRWHHLFGLSLGLKFHYRPHNRTKTFFAVVWKQCTNAAVYREVALQAARQLEGAHCDSKGDLA